MRGKEYRTQILTKVKEEKPCTLEFLVETETANNERSLERLK